MTNLTKESRAAIIDSVIKTGTDLPEKKKDLTARLEQRVRAINLERVDTDFYRATKTLPAEWFPHKASTELYHDVNPAVIMALSPEDLKRSRRYATNVNFEPIKYPTSTSFSRAHFAKRHEQPDDLDSWEVRLADLIDEAKVIRAAEDKARAELGAFLNSVRTYKQVLEKMPELERHLPAVVGKNYAVAVPVAPLLATLGSLGFDKSAAEV